VFRGGEKGKEKSESLIYPPSRERGKKEWLGEGKEEPVANIYCLIARGKGKGREKGERRRWKR